MLRAMAKRLVYASIPVNVNSLNCIVVEQELGAPVIVLVLVLEYRIDVGSPNRRGVAFRACRSNGGQRLKPVSGDPIRKDATPWA